MIRNSIKGTLSVPEIVHCTVIEMTSEQEKWTEWMELGNYRVTQWWLKMPQAAQLSNSLVSTVTFLKESNFCIIWPHMIIKMETICIIFVTERIMRKGKIKCEVTRCIAVCLQFINRNIHSTNAFIPLLWFCKWKNPKSVQILAQNVKLYH